MEYSYQGWHILEKAQFFMLTKARFHSYKIQDTSHTIEQTLIVIVLPWQSVQSMNRQKKRRKQRQWVWKSRRKEEWCLPYRPPRDPFWAACIQPALSCLWHKSSYSRSLPLPLSHSLSLSLHPRTAFQTKARGKIPAPKFRCCWLNKPSQWRNRQQPMRKQEGRWTGHNHMRWRKREQKALGNDIGGGREHSSQRKTRQRR